MQGVSRSRPSLLQSEALVDLQMLDHQIYKAQFEAAYRTSNHPDHYINEFKICYAGEAWEFRLLRT